MPAELIGRHVKGFFVRHWVSETNMVPLDQIPSCTFVTFVVYAFGSM